MGGWGDTLILSKDLTYLAVMLSNTGIWFWLDGHLVLMIYSQSPNQKSFKNKAVTSFPIFSLLSLSSPSLSFLCHSLYSLLLFLSLCLCRRRLSLSPPPPSSSFLLFFPFIRPGFTTKPTELSRFLSELNPSVVVNVLVVAYNDSKKEILKNKRNLT